MTDARNTDELLDALDAVEEQAKAMRVAMDILSDAYRSADLDGRAQFTEILGQRAFDFLEQTFGPAELKRAKAPDPPPLPLPTDPLGEELPFPLPTDALVAGLELNEAAYVSQIHSHGDAVAPTVLEGWHAQLDKIRERLGEARAEAEELLRGSVSGAADLITGAGDALKGAAEDLAAGLVDELGDTVADVAGAVSDAIHGDGTPSVEADGTASTMEDGTAGGMEDGTALEEIEQLAPLET